MRACHSAILLTVLVGVVSFFVSHTALADDKAQIDANTQRALAWIRDSGGDAAALLDRAAGVLVFPDMVKMGFGVGGEFGEGVLVVGGETVDYYATAGDTFGDLPNADYKAEVIFFMTEEALQAFRDTHSWKVGEHATVAVMTDSAGGVAALDPSQPHVGLIFSEDGVVTDHGFDGDRVTLIVR
jgi:lipid-binding SYLF domain-containing protein